jgi:aminoglycoside phosphotransferase (APT) family kinase protein
VPQVLLADDGSHTIPYPSLLFQWTDGLTLNAFRRAAHPSSLLLLAEPLGQLLAQVRRIAFPPALAPGVHAAVPESSLDRLLATAEKRLRRGRARDRLGAGLADGLWHQLSRNAGAFEQPGPDGCLVHGDLDGRNILVAQNPAGAWHIAAVLDWEDAFSGWPLWDVGSLFRYPRRYSVAFRTSFADGYRGSGGHLPEAWWQASRLLDATRQIATLCEERDRPEVFTDCRELLETLLRDDC